MDYHFSIIRLFFYFVPCLSPTLPLVDLLLELTIPFFQLLLKPFSLLFWGQVAEILGHHCLQGGKKTEFGIRNSQLPGSKTVQRHTKSTFLPTQGSWGARPCTEQSRSGSGNRRRGPSAQQEVSPGSRHPALGGLGPPPPPPEASLTPRLPRRLRKDASRGLTDLLISLSMAKGSRPERGDGGPLGNAQGRGPPRGERGGGRGYRRGQERGWVRRGGSM